MSSLLPFVMQMYSTAAPQLGPDDVELVVIAAIDRARDKHADFDRFLPGIDFLSRVIFSNHAQIPLDDYLETLYCAVKHGDFTKSWRTQLKATSGSSEPKI